MNLPPEFIRNSQPMTAGEATSLIADMRTITRPPVRYPGGKWRIGQWIIHQFPPHLTYCEPFCGGASILFRKQPSYQEVINDLDGSVVNFFKVLRERPKELIGAIELTPFAREEYTLSFVASDEPLEWARRFYVRTRQAWGGMGKQTGWRFQRSDNRGKKLMSEWTECDHLYEAAARLRLVMIEHDDAFKIMTRFDHPKTLFYVDPPYLGTSRDRQAYAHRLDESDHVRLAEALNSLQGMVILSGYPGALYDELYNGWTMLEKANQANGNNMTVERLWLSPKAVELGRLPLFEEML